MKFLAVCLALSSSLVLFAQQPQPLEVVTTINSQDISGVVVTQDGRMFIGAPHEVDDYAFPTLAEYKDDQLVPYPNRKLSMPGNPNLSKRLVSVHGMTLDGGGILWMIDDGNRQAKPLRMALQRSLL